MIIAKSVKVNEAKKRVLLELQADTKAEVTDDITKDDVDGWDDDYEIELGSTCLTMTGDFAFRTSDGHWNWQ